MKALLIALLFGVAWAGPEVQPSEVNGPWHTLVILSDTPVKIQEDGPLRGLFRHIKASQDGKSITITFYVKQNGQCHKYTVVGVQNEKGVFMTDYSGENYFQMVEQDKDIVVFYNQNVDKEGRITRMILVAGKEQSLTEEQQQRLEKLAQERGIPTSTIQHVLETDDCPQE
ncbi:lipocalin Cav p 3.0101-like [Dipodomys merriami]|uniref:lipocalin Cav p 3.0101-like n=1 Tax=Dipodomys merriami TaxID=94247 RepID=UPI003855BA99